MNILEWLRVIFLGIVEGITEWLPVSSTGHLILVDEFWKTSAPQVFTESFTNMFEVVIQLGAILAVVTVFFHKLNPFSNRKTAQQRHNTMVLWGKVIVGCLPAAVVGLLFNDWMEEHLMSWQMVAAMLIVYGVLFMAIEWYCRRKDFRVTRFSQLSYGTALLIGVIQILSLVPGTSRSGVTILGAMLLGCSRFIAAEYTFYLAIPVMFGASGLKIVKFLLDGGGFTGEQFAVVLVAMLVAYLVSIFVIKFLMDYIKRHDFRVFGVYRIVLGVVVILCFSLIF